MPLLQESLALQPASHDRSRVDTLLELARARSGVGDLDGAEAAVADALKLAQNEFGAASAETGRALWANGRLRATASAAP